jgi:hypothetical protein
MIVVSHVKKKFNLKFDLDLDFKVNVRPKSFKK